MADTIDIYRGASDVDAPVASAAFVSTFPPRRCGLATFTADLMEAVQSAAPDIATLRVAMREGARDGGSPLDIAMQDAPAYRRAGSFLNAVGAELVCVQHEYGIFGGADGELLLDLLDEVVAPVVTTLHTVLGRPSTNQRRITDAILRRSDRVVVMTEHSAALLGSVYAADLHRVEVVPHGIPAPAPQSREACRREFGVQGRPMLLTFGLLSPDKGLEHVIRALPAIAARWPDVLYLVMGVTHPNLVKQEGEAHRDHLTRLAARLGVGSNVRFLNAFAAVPELTRALMAADIYVTPYLNEAQSVSGTLAYSYGVGTAVLSTPYHHAADLLAEGRGELVPFADPGAIGRAVTAMLADPVRLARMRRAAREDGRRMLWPTVGARYAELFREAVTPVAAYG